MTITYKSSVKHRRDDASDSIITRQAQFNNDLLSLVSKVEKEDYCSVADNLRRLSDTAQDKNLSVFLSQLSTKLEKANLELIDDYYVDHQLVFFLAPFTRRVNGQDITKLTLVVGEIRQQQASSLEQAAISVFGCLNQNIPELLAIDVLASCGNIGGEEAFISPGGWRV